VLEDRTVSYLVHLVEVPFELDEVFASSGVRIDHALMELLEGVDDSEEVVLGQEELIVVGGALLDDGLG